MGLPLAWDEVTLCLLGNCHIKMRVAEGAVKGAKWHEYPFWTKAEDHSIPSGNKTERDDEVSLQRKIAAGKIYDLLNWGCRWKGVGYNSALTGNISKPAWFDNQIGMTAQCLIRGRL